MTKVKFKVNRIYIDKKILLVFFLIAVIIGKYARWNFESNLVDNAIGFNMLDSILSGSAEFKLWDFNITSSTYDNSVFLYTVLYLLFKIETYIQFEIAISIILNLILFLLIAKYDDRISILQFAIIFISVALLNLTSFTLSKEPIQMIMFVIIYYILKNTKLKPSFVITAVLVIISVFIVFFRSYYVFMLMFFMIFQYSQNIVARIVKKNYNFLFLLLISAITFFVVLQIASAVMPSLYNELYRLRSNERFAYLGANTEIKGFFVNIIRSDLFLTLDFLLTSVRLLFPVEVLFTDTTMNNFVKIAFVLYQIIISVFILLKIRNYHILSDIQKIAVNLFVAFILMSAIFEPDFGSWIRHESVTLPLMMVIFKLNNADIDSKRLSKQINKTDITHVNRLERN